MSCDDVIIARGLGKAYRLFDKPADQVIDLLHPGRGRGRDFWALRAIDLTVRRGETVGVIGRNGSGKSTLLHLICGTVKPSIGELTLRGKVAALLEFGAGFSSDFTGRENVILSAAVLGLSTEEIAARFPSIEAFADIGAFIDRPVREYSTGMRARLAFAVSVHVDADILLIDEILAVGDARFQQKCVRFLKDFRKRGTLVFVSHDEAAVLSLCDRVIWLEAGVMKASGPGREIYHAYITSLAESFQPNGRFQAGGTRKSRVLAPSEESCRSSPQAPAFDYDPDAAWHGDNGASIELVTFEKPDGASLVCGKSGDAVALLVRCRASRPLARPILGFNLRNGLGVHLFGDHTDPAGRNAPELLASGEIVTATFRFRLPDLPTGDYVVEAYVFENAAGRYTPVARRLDAAFLTTKSKHNSEGFANVAMRGVRLELENP
jgi:lipopolysaccharide transport system ATP-binding protein